MKQHLKVAFGWAVGGMIVAFMDGGPWFWVASLGASGFVACLIGSLGMAGLYRGGE